MATSMSLTMTTLTGRCMPLVEVLTQPSTARAIDILLRQTLGPKKYVLFFWMIYFTFLLIFLFPCVNLTEFTVYFFGIGIGHEKGGYRYQHVEELELEVGGGPSFKRCLLHPIRGRSLCKLLQGLQPRRQVLFHGWLHHFRCRSPLLPQGRAVLVVHSTSPGFYLTVLQICTFFFFFSFFFLSSASQSHHCSIANGFLNLPLLPL